MENAAEALKMAAAVLAFVIALGIGISSFSQARATADILIKYSDRDTVTQYIENVNKKTRIVGKETIIPTIYRAYKENYRIQFYESDGTPITLYTKKENGVIVNVNYIDLEREVIRDEYKQNNFIMALLYGAKGKFTKADGSEIGFSEFNADLNTNNSGIILQNVGIYDRMDVLKGNTFEEKYGVYYQDDVETGDTNTDEDYDEANTPDINKTKKRVISYYKQ